MKIGILSLVLHSNYGGILQSYALQTVLERMGHGVIVLNRNRDLHRTISQEILAYVKYLLKRFLLRRNILYKSANQLNIERYEKEVNTRAFIEKYIHTRMVNGLTKEMFREMDAVIVGSDQVWRPRYFKEQWNTSIEDAYLRFLADWNIKRISYAASFGTDEWEYDEKETMKCSDYIKQFSLVTVRERSAISMCMEHFCVNSYQVLDPTLLLEKEDYIRIVEVEKEPKSVGNLFCYILDNSQFKKEIVTKIASEQNMIPFYVNIGERTNHYSNNFILSNIERFKSPSVTKWLRGFMDAEMVIADSFHAVAFSIIFNKPFWVIGNKKRGLSRFCSILELFHLENRMLDESEINDSFDWNYPIDWKDVNRIKSEWKTKSVELLRNGLTI